MEHGEFDAMDRVEDDMWWYHGLHARFVWGIRKFCTGAAPLVLDAGCGTGGFLGRLRDRLPCRRVGLEYFFPACRQARRKAGAEIVNGTVNQLPFAAGSIDAVVLGDILCQDTVDVTAALDEINRCLRTDGIVLVNVPAYTWMRSRHDELVHAARRYTTGRMASILEERGFRIVYRTYWNTLLFPLMVLRRKVLTGPGSGSDVFVYPRPVNFAFRSLLRLEGLMFDLGIRFPFGGSVFVIGRKAAK